MLQEITAAKQDGKDRKRWFRDDTFDVYVWQNGKGEFTTLQLCYDRAHDERVMRWSKARGYSHERIDAPETKPGRAMSAILVVDGMFPADIVLERFRGVAGEMPHEIAVFVEKKIRAYKLSAAARRLPPSSKPLARARPAR
jgi:hypothetical protein